MADDAVCVWDLNDATRTTSPQLVLRGHAGPVSALAALDGGRLASAGDDKVIRIWNVAGDILEAATPVTTLKGHTGWVRSLAAPDDGRLASGSSDNSVIIWRLADGRRLAKLKGHTSAVLCLAALDDDRLASGSYDESVIIWNLADGAQLAMLEGHTGWVRSLAALDGDRLASGSHDESVIIWNLADGTQLDKLEGHTHEYTVAGVNCLAALDGDRLASGSDDESIIIWNLADGTQVAKLGHTSSVRCLAALDGGRLASGVNDATIIIWNLADGTQLDKLEHTSQVNCLAALGGGRLASGGDYRDPEVKEVKDSAVDDSLRTDVDRFGSRPLAGAIVDVVGATVPPLCVGLYAKWGRGKSFLMRQIKQHFDPTARVDPRGGGQLVQHFEPGYDKLTRAVTDERYDTVEKTSPSTCTKVLNIIGNALFYLVTLTLWMFYKRETVITIIDTVTETIHDLGVIGKDLRKRVGTILGCCSSNTHEIVLTDDIESKKQWSREYIFVDFNACADSVSLNSSEVYSTPRRRDAVITCVLHAGEYAQSDELWTGLIKKMYAAVELRLSKQEYFTSLRKKEPRPNEARVVTSLARSDWKTAWRVKRAKELLTTADEWSTWGLRLRALLMILLPWGLVGLIITAILDLAGVSVGLNIFATIGEGFGSAKKFFELVAASVVSIVAAVAAYRAKIKTDEVAGKSRGEVFFEEAKQQDSIRDRLGFLAQVKDEVTELFSFLQLLDEETGLELVIVPFVDDLDRVMNNNGERIIKVLEAVSLILSIDKAPVVTFLAIDPRIIIHSIEDSFGAVIANNVTGWEYLEKIIHVPIAIPEVSRTALRNSVSSFLLTKLDPWDATSRAVAMRLRQFATTLELCLTQDNNIGYLARFPDGQEIPLDDVARMIRKADGSGNIALVRSVARGLTSTRDDEVLITPFGEEGLEITCRALNTAFRDVNIIKSDYGSRGEATGRTTSSTMPQTRYKEATRVERVIGRANTTRGQDTSEQLKAALAPSFRPSALLVETAEQMALEEFAAETKVNPRRLQRVAYVFQLVVAYAKRLAMDNKDPTKTVYLDPRWPLFSLKIIKMLMLCEEHPIRMSLLISQVEDAHQKAEVNNICTPDMFQYLADDHQTPAKHLEPSMLLATFYYKHADSLYYLQRDCSRNLMQDKDPENFAMMLSTKLPDSSLEALPESAVTCGDAGGSDIVVRDLTGQDGALSLLDFALNLSPALRDTITRDVAQNVSTFEPRLPRPFLGFKPDSSLREGSVQPKADYLLQPPKARE